MAAIDLQPIATAQGQEREDIANVAGFSDEVFELLASFAARTGGPDFWVRRIAEVAV
jgi:60 kDa SS-A/Ro ribonucleoprotein